MEDVHGSIKRSNSDGDTIARALDISLFNELLALDWEADNSTGKLNITTTLDNVESCRILMGESQ